MLKQTVLANGGALPAEGPTPDDDIIALTLEATRSLDASEKYIDGISADFGDFLDSLKARGIAPDSREWIDEINRHERTRQAARSMGPTIEFANPWNLLVQAFAIPAQTAAGRAAKARAWLAHMAPGEWDDEPEERGLERALLIEILSEYCGVSHLALAVGRPSLQEDHDLMRRSHADRAQRAT